MLPFKTRRLLMKKRKALLLKKEMIVKQNRNEKYFSYTLLGVLLLAILLIKFL